MLKENQRNTIREVLQMLAYQMTMKIEMEPKAAEETEAQESRLTSHRSKVTNGVDWKYVNPRAARKFLDSPYVFLAWQQGRMRPAWWR